MEGGEYEGEVEDFIGELVLHESLLTELNLHELASNTTAWMSTMICPRQLSKIQTLKRGRGLLALAREKEPSIDCCHLRWLIPRRAKKRMATRLMALATRKGSSR